MIFLQIELGKPLSEAGGITVQSLRDQGFKAIFMGIGE